MKLGPVTKLNKHNAKKKKNDGNVMTLNCNVIVIFPIYGQFGANLGLHGLQTLYFH